MISDTNCKIQIEIPIIYGSEATLEPINVKTNSCFAFTNLSLDLPPVNVVASVNPSATIFKYSPVSFMS